MLRFLILFAISSFLTSCASSKVTQDPEMVNDVMTQFVQKAQAGFWADAMANVTPEERDAMMEDGQVMQEYKDAVARIRLSTIRNMNLSLDSKGRLVGLLDILDGASSFSGEESKIGIDTDRFEEMAAQRKQEQEAEEERKKELAKRSAVRDSAEAGLNLEVFYPDYQEDIQDSTVTEKNIRESTEKVTEENVDENTEENLEEAE